MLMWGFVKGYHGLFQSFWGGSILQISPFAQWLTVVPEQRIIRESGISFSFTPTVRVIWLTWRQIEEAECCFLSKFHCEGCTVFSCKHIPTHCRKLIWERNCCRHFLGVYPALKYKANHTAGPVPAAYSRGSQSGCHEDGAMVPQDSSYHCFKHYKIGDVYIITFYITFSNTSKQKKKSKKHQNHHIKSWICSYTARQLMVAGCHSNTTRFLARMFFRSSAVRKIKTVGGSDGNIWHSKQSSKKCWNISALTTVWQERIWGHLSVESELRVGLSLPTSETVYNSRLTCPIKNLFLLCSVCLFGHLLNMTSF